ncbi:MAG TPA: SIMPL domain-containing protein, partial [Candidatus Acidoferrum sp.]|nr:SIMPL domain-containing protein [Candidatus Acidoferrum sp.]
MTNSRLLAATLFTVCLNLVSCHDADAAEKTPPAAAEMKIIHQVDHTEITLSQQAERMEARNRIMVRLMVEAKGSNARQIQLEINKRMTAAIQKAQSRPDITVETGSYSVNRPYNPQLDREADRWRGMQLLSLTSDDFDAVLALAGELQSDGLVMNDMRFFVAP